MSRLTSSVRRAAVSLLRPYLEVSPARGIAGFACPALARTLLRSTGATPALAGGAARSALPALHLRLARGYAAAPVETPVAIPSMGDSISEGTIATILKKAGDAVKMDETVAQIETDKVRHCWRWMGGGGARGGRRT